MTFSIRDHAGILDRPLAYSPNLEAGGPAGGLLFLPVNSGHAVAYALHAPLFVGAVDD